MEKSKSKYQRKIEVEETGDGVILHLVETSGNWSGCYLFLVMGVMCSVFFSIVSYAETAMISDFQWVGLCLVAVVISFIFLAVMPGQLRIVLDANELRLEQDRAFHRIMVRQSRDAIEDLSVFYMRSKYTGRVRLMLKDGGYTHLIEESGENCQKIADVLNHNLQWMKQTSDSEDTSGSGADGDNKKKPTSTVKVETTDSGVIVYVNPEHSIDYRIVVGGILASFAAIPVLLTIFDGVHINAEMWILGFLIFILLFFRLIYSADTKQRIVLDHDELRVEKAIASSRVKVPVRVSHADIRDVTVSYFRNNRVGRVRVILRDGGHTNLIEASAENCQKIADVLNHNLQWMKQG